MILLTILIILAAAFKAVADTLDDHFDTSVFKNLPWQVWDANRATTKKFWITNYKLDPWHVSNSLMIVCFSMAIIFNRLPWQWYYQLVYIGSLFNMVFELLYSKILRRK